jgi:CRISPR/Cas system-associated endoribonuclease Cas2
MVNLITYDLKKPGRDYSALYDAIKAYGDWDHIAESVWTIDTNNEPSKVRDNLQQHVDSNDLIFVVRLQQNWACINLSESIVNWLKSPKRSW